jgi:hypothetical protein
VQVGIDVLISEVSGAITSAEAAGGHAERVAAELVAHLRTSPSTIPT